MLDVAPSCVDNFYSRIYEVVSTMMHDVVYLLICKITPRGAIEGPSPTSAVTMLHDIVIFVGKGSYHFDLQHWNCTYVASLNNTIARTFYLTFL